MLLIPLWGCGKGPLRYGPKFLLLFLHLGSMGGSVVGIQGFHELRCCLTSDSLESEPAMRILEQIY